MLTFSIEIIFILGVQPASFILQKIMKNSSKLIKICELNKDLATAPGQKPNKTVENLQTNNKIKVS